MFDNSNFNLIKISDIEISKKRRLDFKYNDNKTKYSFNIIEKNKRNMKDHLSFNDKINNIIMK
jgi:hypothetical protein